MANSGHDSDVALKPGIDFKRIRELAAETRHLDRLARAQTTNVDPGRGTNKHVDLAGAVVNENDEPERQVVNDWLRDRSSDADK